MGQVCRATRRHRLQEKVHLRPELRFNFQVDLTLNLALCFRNFNELGERGLTVTWLSADES